MRAKDKYRSSGGYFTLTGEAQMRAKLLEGYEALQRQAAKLEQDYEAASRGDFASIGPELEEILTNRNINVKALREAKGAQVFMKGYVWDTDLDGQSQLRTMLLVSHAELEKVVDRFEDVANEISGIVIENV